MSLIDVINKVSKRNIEALGKVEFSARIDFSADGGLRIAGIEHIGSVQPEYSQYLNQQLTLELNEIFDKVRITKNKKNY